jgi:hypothetical protein
MEKLIGSAPTDPGDTASWVEYVGWDDFGLFIGSSRPMWEDYDGVGRFVGWQLRGERDGLDLRTMLRGSPTKVGMHKARATGPGFASQLRLLERLRRPSRLPYRSLRRSTYRRAGWS